MIKTVYGLCDFIYIFIGVSNNSSGSLALEDIYRVYCFFYELGLDESAMANNVFQYSLEMGLNILFQPKGISSKLYKRILRYSPLGFLNSNVNRIANLLREPKPGGKYADGVSKELDYLWARVISELKNLYSPSNPYYNNFKRMFKNGKIPETEELDKTIENFEAANQGKTEPEMEQARLRHVYNTVESVRKKSSKGFKSQDSVDKGDDDAETAIKALTFNEQELSQITDLEIKNTTAVPDMSDIQAIDKSTIQDLGISTAYDVLYRYVEVRRKAQPEAEKTPTEVSIVEFLNSYESYDDLNDLKSLKSSMKRILTNIQKKTL